MATTYQGSHQEYDVICQRDVMIPMRDDGASGMLKAESSLNQLSNFRGHLNLLSNNCFDRRHCRHRHGTDRRQRRRGPPPGNVLI